MPNRNNIYRLDPTDVRHAFNNSVDKYDESAVLELEVMQRLLERLDLVRLETGLIVDAGAGTGRAIPDLSSRYPGSRILAVDFAEQMMQSVSATGAQAVCADLATLPLADSSVELVFSNLALPWVSALEPVLDEFYRVLKPRGLLSFSSFGPDTLYELREAWPGTGSQAPVLGFTDLHDVGDALVHTGFTEPVVDAEHFTLTYDSVDALLTDLTDTGAQNVIHGTIPKQASKQNVDALTELYERFRNKGKLPATYEVLYGHAWAPVEKRARRSAAGEFRIPASGIGLRSKD